jgi:hypothetical protein
VLPKLLWTGVVAAIAGETTTDESSFLRRLRPYGASRRTPVAPSGAQLGPRSSGGTSRGPNPYAVVAVAAAIGVLLAKAIDWRGHAHPRR